MLRPQIPILAKIDQYLKLKNPEHEFPETIKEGACFGFSVCLAAMRLTGKLDWWNAALDKVLEWDGQAASLQKTYLLPNSDKEISLSEILERVSHYILFNHANEDDKFSSEINLNQDTFLLPGNLFAINNGDQELVIQDHCSIAGHFDTRLLVNSLRDSATKSAIKNNMCIIYNHEHVCELTINAIGQWEFYDSAEGGSTFFDNIKSLSKEIFLTLGHLLTIKIVSVENIPPRKQPFSGFYRSKYLPTALENQGLIRMIKETPEDAFLILKNLLDKKDPSLEGIIKSAGDEALYLAVIHEHSELVTLLVQAGVKIDDVIVNKKHLLDHAVRTNISIVKMLLKLNANPNVQNEFGRTALITAVKKGYLETVKLLCKKGANTNITDHQSMSALTYAVEKRNFSIIFTLLKAGADPNVSINKNDNLLLNAVKMDDLKLILILLKFKANPNLPNSNNVTPLICATIQGNFKIINHLLVHSANPWFEINMKVSSLKKQAEIFGKTEAFECYLTNRFKENTPTQLQYFTVLHLASFLGYADIAKKLLAAMPAMPLPRLIKIRELALIMDHIDVVTLFDAQINAILAVKQQHGLFTRKNSLILRKHARNEIILSSKSTNEPLFALDNWNNFSKEFPVTKKQRS